MKITQVPLGFPVNKTINTELSSCGNPIPHEDGTTYNYKIIIRCTEEERKKTTEAKVTAAIRKANPQAESVRVVFDVEKPTHIRSPKIIKARTNAEKLAEYLRVNELSADDGLYALEKEIEDGLEIKYDRPRHSFTLLRVRLRGSIGMNEKSGREEYELDFREFPDGLIAIAGRIGAGKSTLIENCQPYLQMLTRSGKLQDHFYLKDSCRQLLYIDEEGTYYDIDIQIDGKNRTGKVKAFVRTGKDTEALSPVPECDGNVDSYTEWVGKTFGPLELYLRTAFYTRGKTGSIPDIAYATKGEKKALFTTLIGIDGLADISTAAREKGKEAARNAERERSALVDLSGYPEPEEYDAGVSLDRKKIAAREKEIAGLNTELTRLQEQAADDIPAKIRGLEQELARLCVQRDELSSDAEFTSKYLANSGAYDSAERLNAEADAAAKKYREFTETELTLLAANHRDLESEILGKERERDVLIAKRDGFRDMACGEINDTCPTCGQKLPESKIRELRTLLSASKVKLGAMCGQIDTLEKEITGLKSEEESHPFHAAEVTAARLKSEADALADSLRTAIPMETVMRCRARYAAIKSPDTLRERLSSTDTEISRIRSEIDGLMATDGIMLQKKVNEVKSTIAAAEHNKQELLMEVGKLTEQKEALVTARKRNAEIQRHVDDLRTRQIRYETLEKAFGANGIQALELEALSPEIADITNDVLETVFGGEYKVSFQTLRMGSGGSLIEDFNILVETVSTGTVRPLEWVSGGEGTIIKEALYNAFGIARQRSCGAAFRTKFADEMDSAIDPDFRPKYLQMLKTVHDLSGTRHTVLITHSSEVKDAVESRIDL